MMPAPLQSRLSSGIREQRDWCRKLGSPFYFELLGRIADDIDASGACWRVLEPFAGEPARSLLPLRFLAAIHRSVLEGKLPKLARHYPGDAGAAWVELVRALSQPDDVIRARMPERVQTNEVGRCSALLPGFQEIARRTRLPLRLLEVGCSAGLNLRFDHLLDCPDVRVAERKGCDLHPIALDDDGRLTLLSFVWPDQRERFEQLSRAIEISRRVPAVIEQADAIEWLTRELAIPAQGVATVVFHSIVMMYFSNADRVRFPELLEEAGARATSDAPLAWLSMEQSATPQEGRETDIDLTIWPGGERRTVARASFHGRNVEVVLE
jgi:hypothetical protein